MKILIFLLFLTSSSVQAETLDFRDQDKQKHFAACLAITTSSYYVYHYQFKVSKPKSLLLSVATAMAIGLVKEATDPTFSVPDIQANAIGSAAGIIIPLSFDF